MDRLTQIQAFVAAVDCQSLAKAAAQEGVTPVMIGRRIDGLERRLGVKLLHRSTRRLTLTEEGILYAERCRQLLSTLDEVENSLTAIRHEVRGRLVVSAPASFGRKHVAAHALSFIQRHPDVELSFNLSDELIDVTRQRFDLAIRMGSRIDPNMVAVRLATHRRVVCGSPAYLEDHGLPTTLEDLAKHNCLAFNAANGLRRPWVFLRGGTTISVDVSGPLDCNDGDLLHAWALAGLGLQWRAYWEVSDLIHSGELVTVLDDFALPAYDITAVYPQNRYVPERVRRFINHLKATYSKPNYWDS